MAIKVGGVLVIDDTRGAVFSGLNLVDTVANKTGSMRFTADGGFQIKLPDATEWQVVGSGDIDGNLGKKIQHVRKLSTEWTSSNPVLSDGEIGYETDTGKFKFGNGTSGWNTLPYSSVQAGSTTVAGVVQLTDSISSTSVITAATPNSVKIAYDLANTKASTTQVGTVQLTDSISSTSITTAATPNAVKQAYDLANTKASTTQVGAVQLTDSIASTSVTTAATPNAVKQAYDLANSNVKSVAGKTGVVTLAKADVGLSNVDNTADANKVVASAAKLTTARTIQLTGNVTGSVSFDGSANASITTTVVSSSTISAGIVQLTDSISSTSITTAATPNAVKQAYDLANGKQATLVSGTNIKTINGTSVLGSGDLVINTAVAVNEDTTSTTPIYPLMSSATSGNINTSNVSSTKCYFIPSSGTFAATQFMSLSDVTKKVNISSIVNGLDVISGLRGVTFNYIDGGMKSSGVIAQELEEVLPFLVDINVDGTRTVNYSGIIGYLIEAVKELKKEISILSKM